MSDEAVGVRLSIFERLTDRNPDSVREPSRSQWASPRELEATVMNHLDSILNARRAEHRSDPYFLETSASVAGYGILDLSSLSLDNPSDRDKVRDSVERAIRLFEPRLTKVNVRVEEPRLQDAALRFRIDAVLRVDPVEEPIAFAAELARDSQSFRVIEARD